MILIFEGADLVGKSTLAERFAGAYGWPIAKIRWTLAGDVEAETRGMAAATIGLLGALRPNLILDRCYFSLWAYGPALGTDVEFMQDLITGFAAVRDARLVLLTASPDALRHRYEREPDLYFSLDVIEAANARFPALLPLLPPSLPSLHIDTTDLSADEAVARIERFIRA